MLSKIKVATICFFGTTMASAHAGSIELTNCEPGSLSYNYTVSKEETAEIFISSSTNEELDLEVVKVSSGSGQLEHDFSDILPDSNNYVTLVDGTSISMSVCQTETK